MTKAEIIAFGGPNRFRPFTLVLKDARRIDVQAPNQMVFARHPDGAVIHHSGALRVLTLSSSTT
jgi:hypothetical protein